MIVWYRKKSEEPYEKERGKNARNSLTKAAQDSCKTEGITEKMQEDISENTQITQIDVIIEETEQIMIFHKICKGNMIRHEMGCKRVFLTENCHRELF